MGIVAIMYERVWEGAAPGPDGTEWDLTLDFNEDTGLFRVCGALDGEAPQVHECADPVVSGLMARSEFDRPDSPEMMALIPPAPLEMRGRFAPFSSPDQIVAGSWRTPRDWPDARKDATVRELLFRRNDIVRLTDDVNPNRLTIMECSRLLNGMYGDPSRWPRRAVDAVLRYPRGTMPGNRYRDPWLSGAILPPEFSAAIMRAGSALAGRALGYRDAVYALYGKAMSDGLYINRDWRNYFGVIPSVDAAQFIRELSEGDIVTLSLAASFNSIGGSAVELGDVRINFKSAAWFRDMLQSENFLHGPLDGHALGKLQIGELEEYLVQSAKGLLHTAWTGAFLDGEYEVGPEGESDRVLISAKVVDEGDCMDERGLLQRSCSWVVVSWSKSEDVYHVELWQAPKYLADDRKSSKQAWRERDSTFDSFPSQFMPDMRTMPMVMDGSGPATFVNARYASDPDRLLKERAYKSARDKVVPGTKSLKENLAKLDTKIYVDRKQGTGSHGQHV